MNKRAESVKAARSPDQAGRGGSIPASALHFHLGCFDEAAALVLKYHYSHRLPGAAETVGTFHCGGGLFGDKGECVAACIFSSPPTRWGEPVLELTRLVRKEGMRPPLTKLICLTVLAVRRRLLWDLLVSFADSGEGHHGGIYQAASWHYHGKRTRAMDGLIVDGQFMPGRTCNATWGTRAPAKVAALLGEGHTVQPHYDEGKHLYWKPINKAGREKAARLGLNNYSYPKPQAVTA